jgi:hypothetical protein
MRWFRFSIASVMAFILYAAIGLAAYAAIDDPSYARLLDDTYFMITVFAVGFATILAVLRYGRTRAMWLGFAVFGWVHLMFGWPDTGGSPPPRFLNGLYRPRFPHMTLAQWNILFNISDSPTNPQKSNYTWHIMQSTVTMATAMVGALVGRFLWRRTERLDGESREAFSGGGGNPSGSSPSRG